MKVVNCSRFVSLKYWTQHDRNVYKDDTSCELLSICIFEILNTAFLPVIYEADKLWIALDLYLWNIEHSVAGVGCFNSFVVNCSRFVSLKYWTQHDRNVYKDDTSCELLSICIFEILNTASMFRLFFRG